MSAVKQAGALAARLFERGVEAWSKAPGEPVTEADLGVDALLKNRLLGSRPDYGWLSEETADSPERLHRRRVWVVDPIDGTRDFARRRSGYAVSAALVEDGAPVLAALFAPARNLLFVAEQGRGATLGDSPVRVSDASEVEGCRVPMDPSGNARRRLPVTLVDKPNSVALRIAMVAAGEADAFFERRASAEWDIAAAALILREAGGTITDSTGAALVFNQLAPRFNGTIACTPALHAPLLKLVGSGR